MNKQYNFTDMEYNNRRRTTKREEFLNKMDSVVPWREWVTIIQPIYPDGKLGRHPQDIENTKSSSAIGIKPLRKSIKKCV